MTTNVLTSSVHPIAESAHSPDVVSHPSKLLSQSISLPRKLGIRDQIERVLAQCTEQEPFYIVNLSTVISQFQRWSTNLPGVKPFYAVKSNPDRGILETLASLGANFDCASETEIREVLSIVNDPNRIIFANPFKIPYQLKYAASVGVKRMTADNVSELEKIRTYYPEAHVLIRIKPDDSKSLSPFSTKFGATVGEAEEMIAFSKINGLKIVGCAFHVGSNCQSAQAYHDVILDCARVFKYGASIGIDLTVLDIGGGFPGMVATQTGDSFEEMAKVINNAISDNFGEFPELEVIGEPGRFFASSSMTLVFNVIGKKPSLVEGKPGYKYYLDEGIYGGFNCIIFDHVIPTLQLLCPRPTAVRYKATVFGPTCDSIDTLGIHELPELYIGEKLFCDNFGAYTACAASQFNGFANNKRFYVVQE